MVVCSACTSAMKELREEYVKCQLCITFRKVNVTKAMWRTFYHLTYISMGNEFVLPYIFIAYNLFVIFMQKLGQLEHITDLVQ